MFKIGGDLNIWHPFWKVWIKESINTNTKEVKEKEKEKEKERERERKVRLANLARFVVCLPKERYIQAFADHEGGIGFIVFLRDVLFVDI